MKKITTLILTFFVFQITNAQVNINLVMNPRPVANISDWAARRDVLTLIATPGAVGGAGNVKINTTIKTADGTTVATTDMLRAPLKTLVPGSTTIFYAVDVVNTQVMVFSSSFQNKINRTGKLPAGSYQIIVRLDSADLPIPASNTQTRTFFLSATQLPVLIMPANETVLPAAAAQTAITFRWTPVIPRPTEAVRYHVQVFEVLADQTPMQALRSNQPLLDQEVVGLTQYIWRPQLSFANGADHKFIWTIQSFDFTNNIITGEVPNGEGRSEVNVFTVSSATPNRLGKRITGL
ncbi:MAG: hypothetical protein WAU23_07190 [Ferruginibacter sp.]